MTAPQRLRRFGAGRSVHEQALSEEMAWHLDCLADELEQDGLSSDDARDEARRRFGDPIAYQRACLAIDARQRRRRRWRHGLDGLRSDLIAALRGLRSGPVYALTVVLTLALAIGMTTAIFSLVDAVLFEPLGLPEADRLLMVGEIDREEGPSSVRFHTATPANFVDWRAESETFSGLAAIETRQPTLVTGGEPTRLRSAAVTEDFFEAVGVPPAIGRVFDREEHARVDARVVVLSDRLFRSRFGGDRSILGTDLTIDGKAVQVVGVMPADFEVPLDTDLWQPLVFDFDVEGARGAHYLSVIGRLAPGIDHPAAFAEMDAIARRLEAEYPRTNTNAGVVLVPLKEAQTGSVRPALLTLVAAVALVLLIACANVAGLALARAAGREREMAVRSALGAPRGRLGRQLLGEAALLALAGGVGGLLLAWLTTSFFLGHLPFDLPHVERVAIDSRILLFTWAVTMVSTLLFGLAPAVRLSRGGLEARLRDHSTTVLGVGQRLRLRQTLVALELGLALVLLSACGLLVRSLTALGEVDLGFEPAGVLTFELDLPDARYDEAQSVAFYTRLLDQLAGVPEVSSTALAPWLPLTPGWYFSFQIAGAPPAPPEARQGANLRMINPGYFDALGIPRHVGRAFAASDDAASPPVIIVNRALAERYFPDRDPIGQALELSYGRSGEPNAARRIVGVVGDVRHFGPTGPALPTVYAPYTQIPFDDMAVALRTHGEPRAVLPAVRELMRRLDPSLAVDSVTTLEERYAGQLAPRRFVPTLLGVFALVALSLAGLGLYGIAAQLVAARTAEIGVRRALGATASAVVWLVMARALALIAAGVVGGLVGAWASTRLFQSLLFGVEPGDPATMLVVSLLLALIALIACAVPAMRAGRVDPVRTLRQL